MTWSRTSGSLRICSAWRATWCGRRTAAAARFELIAENPPDVVLSDIRMPEIDGFEVCESIKADPHTRLIPVVLMTASREERDRVRALDAGADDLLPKPFDQSELKARVRSLVRLKQFTDDLESAETVLRSLAQELIELPRRGDERPLRAARARY